MAHDQTYRVQQWGWVYAPNGKRWGITGTIGGLSYQDVCEQIRNAARSDRDVSILDSEGKPVSLILFTL